MAAFAFEALRECACAIQSGDMSRADFSMKRALDHLAEQKDSGYYGEERLVGYFAEALTRRAYGLLPKCPPDFKYCYPGIEQHYYFMPTKMIEDVIDKASWSRKIKLHLIFFSPNIFQQDTIAYMRRLQRLQKVLRMWLKVTLIVTSNSSPYTADSKIQFVNRMARSFGVTFEYVNRIVIINNSLDELDVSRLKIDRNDEFVVVNCSFLLGYMLPAAMSKFLVMLRDGINPDIFILAERDANLNQDDFLPRFNESVQYYSDLSAFLEGTGCPVPYLQNEISNVVACEGGARVVRHMTFDQWRDLLNKSGCSPILIPCSDDDDNNNGFFEFTMKNGCVVVNAKDHEPPIYFFSAWKRRKNFDEVIDFYHDSLEGDHNFQNIPISPDPKHRSLIQTASLAEIYDMTHTKVEDRAALEKMYNIQLIVIWRRCEDHAMSSLLNPCLCIVGQIGYGSEVPKYHLQQRNHVSKTFESNRPCFQPHITEGKRDLPYLFEVAFADDLSWINGAFTIKLNSLFDNCEGYVVEFLFDFPNDMVDEERISEMDKILWELRNEKSSFVTCNTPDVVCISHQNDLMDSSTSELLNLNEVSDVQEELFLPYGSSTLLARDQNLLVDSSTRDIDLNDEISFDIWKFSNLAVGDDMDVQVSSWPPHQLDKEQGALKNVISRDVAEKGKTVFQETIPIDEGKLLSKRQFQVGMSFTTCGRMGNDNSPSWGKATRDERLKMLNFTYGVDGSVKPKMAKPPAVISNSKAQCSSHGYDRRMFHSQKTTKERKSTWSKKNVKEYLMYPLTSEDENRLTAQRRLKPSGKTVTKVGIWDIKDKSLARLVCPLDNIIMPDKLYIDDTVIDAYFHLLKKRRDTYPNKYLKHHSFSCFIASKLFSGQAEDLSTWFDPKDIMDTHKLFLPLCLPNSSHWVLFCVDINNRQFLWLDSLKNSRKSHESEMKVILEWFVGRLLPRLGYKDASKWTSRVLEDIPTQEKNMVDCGVFVMKYADCLTHGDCFPFSQADMLHFRSRVFLDIVDWNIHVPHRFISN